VDIILHVGAHRTASTTLQRMMGASKRATDAAGVAYWGPKRTRSGLFNGLGGITLPRQRRRVLARIGFQAAQLAQGGTRALWISEENLLGTMRRNIADLRLYPDAADKLAPLGVVLGDHPLTVAMAVRSYDSYWASVLAFRLTRGGAVPTPDLIDRLITQPRRWRHVVASVAAAVPQARVVVWTHEAMADMPDRLVGHLTGVQMALHGADAWCNTMPSIGKLRETVEDFGGDPTLLRATVGRFMPFDDAQRAVLRAQYADDLAWLRAGAGGMATYIDDLATEPDATGQARGYDHDRKHRRLA